MAEKKCPDGILTEKVMCDIYSQLFPCGSTTLYARHLFSAMEQQINYCIPFNGLRKTHEEINFKEFLIALSSLMRGTIDDKIKWLFNFYDINKDQKITYDVRSVTKMPYWVVSETFNIETFVSRKFQA
jgi:Ca2+-binding EF-hand superfamily protein